MVSNIFDLTNVLREVRNDFQAAFVDAEEVRKKELEALRAGYIRGSEVYKTKEEQIQFDYDTNVVRARAKAAEKAQEALKYLKEWEVQRTQRIDTEALAKINSIRNIPVTANELKVILKKFPTSNYWVQKAIAAMADDNAIPQSDLGIDAPLDTKLHVLDQLSDQLETMLQNYTLDPNRSDRISMESRWLYLNDDVLQNAVNVYTNNIRYVLEMDASEKAFYKIKITPGQMQRGVMIANSLRNLKGKDAKNALMFRLSQEQSIAHEAYEIAGISSEMSEWKNGKSERYIKAKKLASELETISDAGKIKDKLRGYLDQVNSGLEQENEFLRRELTKKHKKNSSIAKALSEMSDIERKAILKDYSETETEPQQGNSETE